MERTLWILWGVAYALCAVLGFVPDPEGGVLALSVLAGVMFFVYPAWLLWLAIQKKNRKNLLMLRNLSLGSLGLTTLVLIVNILAVRGSETLGNVLHGVLILVSVPMVCLRVWVLSLFFWACLLVSSQTQLRKLSSKSTKRK